MPTYRNDTGRRITFQDKNGLIWEPGASKRCPFFVPYKDLGLTLESEEPYVLRGTNTRGFGYKTLSLEPGVPTRFEIPYSDTIELSVIVIGEPVFMYIGDCEEPVTILPFANHVSRYPWDMSAYLTFEASAHAVVHVKVEPFTERGQ